MLGHISDNRERLEEMRCDFGVLEGEVKEKREGRGRF